MVRAELVALETGAAEMAVPGVHGPVFLLEYAHRAEIDADTAFPAAVRINVHFKLDGGRQADFHGRAHGPGRYAAAERETFRRTKAWSGSRVSRLVPGFPFRSLSLWFIKISEFFREYCEVAFCRVSVLQKDV
jgi:hypothetical protein